MKLIRFIFAVIALMFGMIGFIVWFLAVQAPKNIWHMMGR